MPYPLLDDRTPEHFPNPHGADAHGFVALSRSLGKERVIHAYRKGIFPWMKMDEPPFCWCWFSPDPRMSLYPQNFKTSRSLAKVLRQGSLELRVDQNFESVMRACATIQRPNQEKSWIEEDMIEDYTALHNAGIAHSIEAYEGGKLVGGLYGLAMDRVFFGESMFHYVPEASKACMAHLVKLAISADLWMIDCQAHNPFLESLGAEEVPRTRFLSELAEVCTQTESRINWKDLALRQ